MKNRNGAFYLWWSLVFFGIFAVRTLADSIVINEIHYNPDVKTEPVEFIELYNAGTNTVNLGGWYFSEGLNYSPGVDFVFPATNVAPGGYAVVAQSPSFLQTKYGAVGAIGPFSWDASSQLSKWGEKLTLRNPAGDIMDEVDFKLGFPWPTVGDTNAPGLLVASGCSIELINPGLDNDLGGSWRSSLNYFGDTLPLITNGSVWRYHKGTNEASSPTTAWRALNFEDSSWNQGAGPLGYEFVPPIVTYLSDMKSNYSSVFLRNALVLTNLNATTNLVMEVMYSGGFKLWINGSNVLNMGMPAGEAAYNTLATGPERETMGYALHVLNQARNYLQVGTNIVAVQAHNTALTNEDFFVDVRLRAQVGPALQGPTPGRRNSVYATNAPPQIRQVEHLPEQPRAGEPVKIIAKVTDGDGVASVLLEYQVVDPGYYIELTDPAYTNNWVSVAMNDNGVNGDFAAGDNVYTAELPGSMQIHRRLVRYRITVADSLGFAVRVPYGDDLQPNFAYFVYNGVPDWRGAIQPGAGGANGQVFTVSNNAMSRLPVIQLIARSNAVWYATGWKTDSSSSVSNRYMGSLYSFAGTLIYDGKVYDHIHYRMRGGVWRYSMVKNMWKFDFNRGRDFEARNNWGKKYNEPWGKLSLGASIQQGDYWHRGEQGMFESVGSRFFQLAGVDSFDTAFASFRVIDDVTEVHPSTQYEGDFWGLYLITENEDGRFLDNHGLPDSNLYKMDGAYGSPPAKISNLGPNGPSDNSDIIWELANYTAAQSESWWRTNWNLPKYYSYQAILSGIHHYDLNGGKNFFYYFNSSTLLWEVLPWDLDLTWAHNMYNNGSGWGGLNVQASRVLKATTENGVGAQTGTYNIRLTGASDRQNFEREFRNRVREIRDLLFNTDQGWKLIDEYAWLVRGPTNVGTTNLYSIIDADRCQWDYNPKMDNVGGNFTPNLNKATSGRFYTFPQESGSNATLRGSFDATIAIMKNYVGIRSEHLDSLALDTNIPNRPTITYTGASNHPISRITFRCSNFSSPTNYTFAYLRWRVGEISDYDTAHYNPSEGWKYEMETVWESSPITSFTPDITIPGSVLRVGSRYRVRVLFSDSSGRNSQWSLPYEFTCGMQDNFSDLLNYLRITEIMFNPPPGGYEYIELHNFSPTVSLDLTGVRFTDGIDFGFANGTMIPPGGYLLVIGTPLVNSFRGFYNLDLSVPIVAYFIGGLNNAGEHIELKTSAGGSNIVAFTYGDGRGWPMGADGAGHSMVLLETAEAAEGDGAGEYAYNWRASTYMNGSAGRAEAVLPPTLLINELAANTVSTNYPTNTDDWIELYNPSDTPLTVGPNWYLSDNDANLRKWMIPSNTVVPGKGFVTFDEETGFHMTTNGFGLNKSGEELYLSYLPSNGLGRVVDSISFKAQEFGTTWGRYPDGGQFWCELTPTPGATNAMPALHLVISELMYHPPDIGGTNDNTLDEFIEIYNPAGSPVELYNTNGTWRLNGGVSLDFPSNVVLNPGRHLLAVNFNPATNLAQLAAFKALYGITDPFLTFVGPYQGKLNNSSDRVALEKPQFDVAGNPAWVLVDEVLYLDQSPWPCGTDGSGSSLQRLSALEHGNDPANWTAQAPTPGAERPPAAPIAPSIVQQPLSQRVPANANVMFLVTVCGPQPLVYQWSHNGQPLPNGTNSVLTLLDVGMISAGEYQVVVSNSAGATYSTMAVLEVYYAPIEIIQQPQNLTVKASPFLGNYGRVTSNLVFSVMVTGSRPIIYQWFRDGAELAGATNGILLLTNATVADEGYYSVSMSNVLGGTNSSLARLRINIDPQIRQHPGQVTVVTGSTVNLSLVAVGHPMPLGYKWRKDLSSVPGGYFYTNSSNCTLTLENVALTRGGAYSVIVTNSAYSVPGALSGNGFLTVVIAPTNRYVQAGSNVTLSVSANCGTSTSKLRYQWQWYGTNLANRTNTSLTLTNFQADGEGIYSMVVINPTNYATAFPVEVFLDSTPPLIVRPPQSLIVTQGATGVFTVQAAGPGPMSYQWLFNSSNIQDATNSTLVLPDVQPTSQGEYTVFISNTNGSVMSLPATLALGAVPTITVQPADHTNNVGDSVTFSVQAEGTTPLFYQWQFNSANILDETNADLLLTNVQTTAAGIYTVVITNVLGAVTSAPAVLILIPETNSSPHLIAVPALVSVEEQTLLSLALQATDPDLPSQTLTWQVGPGSPLGLSIDSASGLLTWIPEEDQGPSTNLVTVVVSDDGAPVLSDSAVISIVVNEVNQPPVLSGIPDQFVDVSTALIFTNIAIDPDIPINRLTFSLDSGAPVGARINPITGRFFWKPALEQAPSTNTITVRVTDDGLPSYSDTKSFVVAVGDYLQLSIGSTVILAGQSGSVDVNLCSKLPITNLNFLLTTPVPGLTNFTLPAPIPPLASATIDSIAPAQWRINLQWLNAQPFLGTQTVSLLRFDSVTNPPSAFIPLEVTDLFSTQLNGAPLTPSLANAGRVVFINESPLLEVQKEEPWLQIILYARPSPDCLLQITPSLASPTWSPAWNGAHTNLSQIILVPMPNSNSFYRIMLPNTP